MLDDLRARWRLQRACRRLRAARPGDVGDLSDDKIVLGTLPLLRAGAEQVTSVREAADRLDRLVRALERG